MTADLATSHGQQRLPRYVGYPAIAHFTNTVGPGAYAQWLKAIPQHASASLYLHAPFDHRDLIARGEQMALYEAALRCEIELISRQIGRRLKVEHVLFGGAPTIMAPESLTDLIGAIRQSFFVLPSAEIAVEIDPRALSSAMIDALALGGINRANLNVQSFDPVVQRAVNRHQTFDQTATAAENLRRSGISALDIDLTYGLPRQTIASCLDTLRRCIGLRPDRFAVFGEPPSLDCDQRAVEATSLLDGRDRHDQACAIANALKEAGYLQIGPHHFAMSSDPLALVGHESSPRRDVQSSVEGSAADPDCVLLGFGAAAIGRLPAGYVQNTISISDYSDAIASGRLAASRGCVREEEEDWPAWSSSASRAASASA
jgi:oxygen-independent coproporphyrinogen-3 oxidase